MLSHPHRPSGKGKRRAILDHYEPRIAHDRQSFDILDWSDEASQLARFHVLLSCVDLADKSLLDVGCGLGDLWGFLKAHGVPVRYVGVDLSVKMLQAAARRQPDAHFVAADVFDAPPFPPASFDVVFSSGLLNLDVGNNREFVPVAARRFVELAREWAVFNLLHARTPVHHRGYVYYEPDQVARSLAWLPCDIHVVDDYLPNDFTLVCRKRRQ